MSPEEPRLDPDDFRDDLRALYADLEAEIARHAPRCVVSGRCCQFEAYGHTLFLSATEAALLLADAPPPARPLDGGATCPWQDEKGRCTAREARPLGCRVYFCDPLYEKEIAPVLSETYIARWKARVAERGLPWDYAPLHRHLHATVGEGPPPMAADR